MFVEGLIINWVIAMKKIIFYAIVFFPTCLFSQAYTPLYKTQYTLTNDSNQNITNYQVLVILNTTIPIASGHMRPDAGDIRFTADSCNPIGFYDHWIEGSVNNDSTRIWVKIPSLAANTSTNFMLWYGDPSSISSSNFNATFPNAYVSNGNDTILGGDHYFDWFQIDSGDVVMVQPNTPLSIRARAIKMNGIINGNGSGYISPLSVSNGNGPGGGGLSSTAGAGGGSYAGIGGTGGMDLGDLPGTGGSIYGQYNDMGCYMGSSGGTTDNAIGGNGGGAIQLVAECIDIGGSILANGNNGIGSIGRCGGGGSGGTILLIGQNIEFNNTGILKALGGNGGNGSSAANDGGGGGSGGRIKIFYGQDPPTANFSLLGGLGGEYGSESYGTDGANGTYFDTIFDPLVYLSSTANETDLIAKIIGLDSLYCLNRDSVLITALPPGGTFSGAGIVANYFYPFTAGVGLHNIIYQYTDPNGCGILFDTVVVNVLNIPTFPTASNNGPVCEGDLLTLSASDSLANHFWTGPNGFTSTAQFPSILNAGEQSNGNYSVTITNAAGCSSTVVTNVVVNTIPEASASNNSPVCIDQELSFIASGGSTYSWNGPNGFSSGLQSPVLANTQFVSQGIYTVTISGSNGCQTTVTTVVEVNGCYFDIEDESTVRVSVYPNPTFNDLWIDIIDKNITGEINIQLYDVYGKKILHQIIETHSNDRLKLELEGIASGNYFVILSGENYYNHFKIIKQ